MKILKHLLLSIFIFITGILFAQEKHNVNKKAIYDNKVLIGDSISKISIESKDIGSNVYYLLYYKNNVSHVFASYNESFNAEKFVGTKTGAIIKVLFDSFSQPFYQKTLNLKKNIAITLKDNLEDEKETSMSNLFKNYYKNNLVKNYPYYKNQVYLFTIPYENNKKLIEPYQLEKSVSNKILYVLFYNNNKRKIKFPDELNGLKLSITNLATGEVTNYRNYPNDAISPGAQNESAVIASATGISKNDEIKDSTVTIQPKHITKNKDDIEIHIKYQVKGPKEFNLKVMPVPEITTLYFPKKAFNSEGTLRYYPQNSKYNPYPQFLKLWRFRNVENSAYYSFNFDDHDVTIDLNRAAGDRSFLLKVTGNYPKKEKIECTIKSKIYKSAINISLKSSGKGVIERRVNLILPDSLLPSEKINLICKKPYNYNLSSKNKTDEWQNGQLVIPVDNNTINVDFDISKISFQFFYIDLSGFKDLQKVKNLLKQKLEKNNSGYLIYISNGDRPLIYKSGSDIQEMFTKISLIRPEPPNKYNELRYIEPYINDLVLNNNRRVGEFNFLFSESFLNHSGKEFVSKALSKWYQDELLQSNKILINFYSTINKPDYYSDEATYEEDEKQINYININKLK